MDSSSITYGPTDDGEYITPYQMTVVFDPSSVFESVVALLSNRAQLVSTSNFKSMNNSDDYFGAILSSCEHISPEVLIFTTDHNFTQIDLDKFLSRGFQFIHVFVYSDDSSCIEDPDHVAFFGIDTLQEHVNLIEGIVPIYVLEHIICAEFPKYVSQMKDMNAATGKCFIKALNSCGSPLSDVLSNLCANYHGFEKIQTMVIKGRTICEVYEQLANSRLHKGIFYKLQMPILSDNNTTKFITYNAFAVHGGEFETEILNLAPIHPDLLNEGVQILVVYTLEPHVVDNITYPGWRITFVGIGKNAPNMYEVLRKINSGATGEFTEPGFADITIGTFGKATTWMPTGAAGQILSFIYPMIDSVNSI